MTQNDTTLDELTGLPVEPEAPTADGVRDGYGSAHFDDTPPQEPDDADEEDFLPPPRQKLGKLSYALIALLIAGLGFLGGVQVQKSHGSTTASTTGFPRTGTRSGEGNFAAGGFPGGGSFGGGTGTGTGGTGAGTRTGSSSGSTADTPVVIGTIASINGSKIVVTNFGGKSVNVTTTDTTKVTKALNAGALAAGQSVSVVGTAAADGTVTATSISVTS